ncbi:uncharacterized protein [Watersipora subatra]|uniref:uncharacterized protein isoform X2 n=1 Tax=Watersipora subatra TaxID=2589382 RepID=UPI00355ACF1B
MVSSVSYALLYRSLAVAVLCYYIFIASTAHCATIRTANNCYNETTQVIVNETKEEWCAVFSSLTCYFTSSCYCNITREVPKTHITTVCEDGGESAPSKEGNKSRKLGDPEVAAIAVISSLIFSIILSLVVFLIQHRQRRNSLKNEGAEVIQLEKGGAGDEAGESVSFLPNDSEKRFIHVQPANKEHNVFEAAGSRPNDDKLVLSLGEGKVTASYYQAASSPSSVTSNTASVRLSQPPVSQGMQPNSVVRDKNNGSDKSPPSVEPREKSEPGEGKLAGGSSSSTSSRTELNIQVETSETHVASSLRLNGSEEHYENSPVTES